MYKIEDFIYIRRNYFCTNLLLNNKDEESVEETAREETDRMNILPYTDDV